MPGRLQGKTTIITGAASGMGRAAALLFANEGSRLAVCDVNEQGLEETLKMIASQQHESNEIYSDAFDLSDMDKLDEFVTAASKNFGVIDVVYNNAGIIHRSPIEETTEADWDRVQAINLKAPFFVVKSALPALQRSEAGSVINVSSTSAMIASSDYQTAYSASKGGVIALTKAQARDLAPFGIRVNCLVPGPIDTPMPAGAFERVPEGQREEAKAKAVSRSPFKRFGWADEVARVALFLATDDSSYVTGATLAVDGGWTAV